MYQTRVLNLCRVCTAQLEMVCYSTSYQTLPILFLYQILYQIHRFPYNKWKLFLLNACRVSTLNGASASNKKGIWPNKSAKVHFPLKFLSSLFHCDFSLKLHVPIPSSGLNHMIYLCTQFFSAITQWVIPESWPRQNGVICFMSSFPGVDILDNSVHTIRCRDWPPHLWIGSDET